MQTILTTFFLLCLTNLAVAQSHSFDTAFKINNQTVHISAKDLDSNFVVMTSTYASRTVLRDTIDSRGLADIEFPDFNKDGNVDILLTYFGNNPTYFLYLFNPVKIRFISIDGYMKYPDAVQLKSNPKYYYSYHRAGCADMNWVSDLFKIVDFKIVQVGHIDAQGCDSEKELYPQVIQIFKVTNNDAEKMLLLTKLPYIKTLKKIDDKWEFIEKYWNQNLQKFE